MKEALKLAREFIDDVYAGEWHGPIIRREQVLEAIDKALAQPEQEPVTGTVGFGYDTVKPYTHEAQQSNEQVEPVAAEREAIAVWLEKDCDEKYLADRVRAGDYAKEKSINQAQKQEPAAYANKVIGGRKWLSIHASKGASDKWLEYRVKEQAQSEEYEQFALYTHLPVSTAQPKEPEQEPIGWVDDGGEVFWKDRPPEDGADLYTKEQL